MDFGNDDSAAFFPNTSQIITISSEHNILRIWDVASAPRLLTTLVRIGPGKDPAISSDGTRLITSSGLWDIVDFRFRKLSSFSTENAKFSPDSKVVACWSLFGDVHIFDAVTGAILHQSRVSYVRSLSFSPDSNQICGINSQSHVSVFHCLPASVDQDIMSCVYHPDSMMMSQQSSDSGGGWYYGVNATRLIWLPDNVRNWCATGIPGFISQYLILGQTANDITILDMEDYLRELPVKGAWRGGGIRYVSAYEEQRAAALASASGLPNYAFSVPYLHVPSKAQPCNQLQPKVAHTNDNHWHIFLHIFIQHLHAYYSVVLRILLSIFGRVHRE